MIINTKEVNGTGIRFSLILKGKEVGRAYLYLLKNDLHQQPFGFIEDVFVNESERGQGIGSKLVQEIVKQAKEKGCYKLICTSRTKKTEVHALYQNIGFQDWGKECRRDFQ